MNAYYEDDAVTIYHGDARIVTEWEDAAVLLTDPPYGMDYSSGWYERPILNDASTEARDLILCRWLRDARPALVFGRWDCRLPPGARTMLTWDKGDWPGMGDLKLPWGLSTEQIYVIGTGFVGIRRGSVIRCDRLSGETLHPNEKPVALLRHLIERCPEGVIADPFCGSGTTLRAAKDMQRRAVGVEIEERFCEIAARRCSQEVLAL